MNSTNVQSDRYRDYFNTMSDVSSDTFPKRLIEPDDNMASADGSAKKGTQWCLIEESYIIKESEIQLRSRYDQFISSKYVAVSRLKVHKRFREPSRIPVKQLERTLNKSRRKKAFIANLCQEKCAKLFQDTSIYKEICILSQQTW